MPDGNQRPQQPVADTHQLRPAIIVGAGGVGKEILMRIRRNVVEHYRSLANLPIIQFLHVDTHTDLNSRTPNVVLGENITFRPDERVELSEQIQKRVGGDIEQVRQDPRINRWLSEQVKVNYDFTTGAGGIRPLGRLCFAYNVGDFRRKLRQAATRATDHNAIRLTQEAIGQKVGRGLDVYIVCSLFGGTGSGCFLEICYNARVSLQDFAPNLTGYLVIGGDQLNSVRMANCYGALKELEYYSTLTLDKTLKPFDVEYPVNEVPSITSTDAPFDVCYLVNWMNEVGQTFNKDELEELLARNILLEFTPGISAAKRGKRIDMLGAPGRDQLDGKLNRFQGFFTFGLSLLEFPAIRIRDSLAYRLAGHAANLWRFDQAPAMQNLPGETESILKRNGLAKEDDLINYLLTAGGEDLRVTALTALKQQRSQIDALFDHPDFDRQKITNEIDGHFEYNKSLVTFDSDPKKCGGYVMAIQEKKKTKLDAAIQSIKESVADMVGNQFQGSHNAETLINDLIARITTFADNLARHADSLTRSLAGALRVINRDRDNLVDSLSPRFRSDLKVLSSQLYEEAQQKYLTIALKREAYRYAYQLIREDLKVNGQVKLCLLSQLGNLKQRIGDFRQRLEKFSRECAQTHADKEENILSTEIVAGVSVTKERLQEVARQVVPNLDQESHALLSELQNELSEKDSMGNVIAPQPIFWAVTEDFGAVEKAIIQLAQRRCDQTKDNAVTRELLNSPNLADAINYSLNQAKVMMQTSGLADQTAHKDDVHHYRWAATCNPQQDPAVDKILENVPGNYLRESILPDKYQIIFAEEMGVFPLRCLPFLKTYKTFYDQAMKEVNPIPRETDRRIQFPDFFPEDVRIAEIRAQAEAAVILGRVLGLLHETEDPATNYPAIYFSFYDEKERDMVRYQVSSAWDDAVNALAQPQIAKEIDHQNALQETPLELLQREITRRGKQADNRLKREQLWLETQRYLETLRDRLEGGDLHREYQRQREIVKKFRDEYQLQGPSATGQPPEESKNISSSAVRVAPVEMSNGRHLFAQPQPASAAPGDDYEGLYRIKIRNELSTRAVLDEAIKAKLLAYGVRICSIAPADAEKILIEESQRNRSADFAAEINRYRELFLLVAESGHVAPEERARLREEQQALGLSDEEVSSIEYPITSEIYRGLFRDALIERVIDRETRKILRNYQTTLGLTDDQARQIESEFIFHEP